MTIAPRVRPTRNLEQTVAETFRSRFDYGRDRSTRHGSAIDLSLSLKFSAHCMSDGATSIGSTKRGLQMGTRIDGRRVLRSTTGVLRSIGQVVITVALVLADVVKSGSGGGASSSALPPGVLPRSETTPSDALFPTRKPPTKKTRRNRRRS